MAGTISACWAWGKSVGEGRLTIHLEPRPSTMKMLKRMPGTAALSVVTLAFEIAAATTTFSAG